jgi:hypothetical protein
MQNNTEQKIKELAKHSAFMSDVQVRKHWLEWVEQALSQQKTDLLTEFEKIIGQDEDEGDYGVTSADQFRGLARNELRAEIRQRLAALKEK